MPLWRGLDRQHLHARSIRSRADRGAPYTDGELAPALLREVNDAERTEPSGQRSRQRLLNAVEAMLGDQLLENLHRLIGRTPALENVYDQVDEAFNAGAVAQPWAHLPLAASNGPVNASHLPPYMVVVKSLDPIEFAKLACVMCAADAVDFERRGANAA